MAVDARLRVVPDGTCPVSAKKMRDLTPHEKRLLGRKATAPLLARLDAATTEFDPQRDRHIQSVALIVLNAKGVK